MPRSVAINVGANTNAPGFRGPIYPDGQFEFLPIPEPEPVTQPVPTYADLPITYRIPDRVRDTPVHFDPEFAGFGPGDRYTYGDPHGVKARPLLDLEAGDRVYFYATLDTVGDPTHDWISSEWGAYLIGRFDLARDPIHGDAFGSLPPEVRAIFANNAHLKRETFDAMVLLHGDPDSSRLLETAIPLSGDTGTEPNRLVTAFSADSGKGPWWRRPLRFDEAGTERLLALERGEMSVGSV